MIGPAPALGQGRGALAKGTAQRLFISLYKAEKYGFSAQFAMK